MVIPGKIRPLLTLAELASSRRVVGIQGVVRGGGSSTQTHGRLGQTTHILQPSTIGALALPTLDGDSTKPT